MVNNLIFFLIVFGAAGPCLANEVDEIAPGYNYIYDQLENEKLDEISSVLPTLENLVRKGPTTYAELFSTTLDSLNSPGYQIVEKRAFANTDSKTPCRNRGLNDLEADKGCTLVYFRLEYTYKTPAGDLQKLIGRGSCFKWSSTNELSQAGLDYFRVVRLGDK